MAVSVAVGTPLAEALSNVVRPKLVEVGWSSDVQDDSALAEYIILMLVNGKTQDQITSELSNDLLNLGPDDTEAVDFSRWLFEQVDVLNRQLNGGGESSATETGNQEASTAQAIPSFSEQGDTTLGGDSGAQDADMGDAGQGSNDGGVPTGPKAMRNPKQPGRGRMMGQISKAMDRSTDSMLHRVRSQPGSGRINTHARDMSKGPRNFQAGNGRMPPGRPMGGPMGMNSGMGMGGQMPRGPGGNMMPMNPQQQMQMMAMLEEQARMMAQFVPGMVPPAINPAFQNGGNPHAQQGRSLFERVERDPQRPNNGDFASRANYNGVSVKSPNPQDTSMSTEMDTKLESTSGAMEVDRSSAEPGPDTVCRFNLKCTRKDCQFAHQSPAAPEGVPVDVTDHCPFGAACKNRKCLGRHPSPAQKMVHQSEELCRFYPNCTNPNCSFKHPSMPMCRNGADCTVSGCKFTHLQIPCKFNPCLNRACPYKHEEGQRGGFSDKVWKAEGGEDKETTHVSERKFIADDDGEEELIKPVDASHNQQQLST